MVLEENQVRIGVGVMGCVVLLVCMVFMEGMRSNISSWEHAVVRFIWLRYDTKVIIIKKEGVVLLLTFFSILHTLTRLGFG